jgi:hypothetical protein
MVTLIMSKFSFGWGGEQAGQTWNGPMKGPRLDAARRASIKARGELADALARQRHQRPSQAEGSDGGRYVLRQLCPARGLEFRYGIGGQTPSGARAQPL